MPFKIVRDDLTHMQVDAIVNTANPHPVIGSGTDSAVYAAAGQEQLLKARKKIGKIERGDAALTRGYNLPAKYIIHTVGPVWQGGNAGEEQLLRSCYRTSLELAAKKRCTSVAFPLISTGNYGFPKDLALRIVVDIVQEFLMKEEMMIYLVVFGSKAARLSERLFADIEARIDEDYVKRKTKEEYSSPYQAEKYDRRTEEYNHSNVEYDQITGRRLSKREDAELFSAPEYVCEDMMSDLKGSASPFLDETMDAPTIGAPPVNAMKAMKAPAPAAKKKKPSARTLDQLVKQQEETFSQMLLRLISEKGMTNAEVYKKANQDRKLFSKIKNKEGYQPEKKTVLAFALGLELNLDETKDLLARAGYAFSPSSIMDRIVQYCIEESFYNIFEVEIILADYGVETLCNY